MGWDCNLSKLEKPVSYFFILISHPRLPQASRSLSHAHTCTRKVPSMDERLETGGPASPGAELSVQGLCLHDQ